MDGKTGEGAIPSVRSITEALRSDPAYMAKHADRERRRDAHIAEFMRLSAPIMSELAAVGLAFSSTEELRNSGVRYQQAVPILIKWLPLVENRGLKESIVRSLSVPWAKPVAARPLIEEFKATQGYGTDGLKWAIGNALEVVADDKVFDDIAELYQDNRHGRAREMLALALGKMKNPRAVDVLIKSLDDNVVAGHALVGLSKLKAAKARPDIERFVDHPTTWIRNAAKKALAKIDESNSRK